LLLKKLIHNFPYSFTVKLPYKSLLLFTIYEFEDLSKKIELVFIKIEVNFYLKINFEK